MPDTLTIPKRWDDVTPAWMTAAIGSQHPDAEVADVTLVLRDDGTNRRARFGLTYAAGSGPATVFAKAESDVEGRREIHAANGNLFNEPLLFRSGIPLPVDHPLSYLVLVDEPGLDYLIVMEDLLARDVDPRGRDATPDRRPGRHAASVGWHGCTACTGSGLRRTRHSGGCSRFGPSRAGCVP